MAHMQSARQAIISGLSTCCWSGPGARRGVSASTWSGVGPRSASPPPDGIKSFNLFQARWLASDSLSLGSLALPLSAHLRWPEPELDAFREIGWIKLSQRRKW